MRYLEGPGDYLIFSSLVLSVLCLVGALLGFVVQGPEMWQLRLAAGALVFYLMAGITATAVN